MAKIKNNIVANYLGSGWNALMGLAFIPLYIHYLGMEAYGLIGAFALLQAWLVLLDLGLTPTIGREMARFEAGAYTPQNIRDLVCSVEWIYALTAGAIALGVMLASPWLATNWLQAESLSTATVVDALTIIGGVIAVRWLAGLYRSAIIGLQRQVWLNGCTAIFSTLRSMGVVVVLAWISPTIQAFFMYQGVLFALEALALAIQMRRLLPAPPQPARFRWQTLRELWRFAAGMTAITFLSIVLMQVDKLLLSRLLPLADFAHYVLANSVAGALAMLIYPIHNVASPRLTELVTSGDSRELVRSYHNFSQMLTLSLVPAALVLSLFSDHILLLWTRDLSITAAVAPLVSLLAIGTMLNGLMHIPYTLQLAYGWTRLTVWINTVSLLVLVPAIYLGVSKYGVEAAAVAWILLNAGYVIVGLPLMHRRLLSEEKWRWYGQDVFAPMCAALIPLLIIRALTPPPAISKPLDSVTALAIAAITVFIAAILVTPIGRNQARSYFRPVIQSQ